MVNSCFLNPERKKYGALRCVKNGLICNFDEISTSNDLLQRLEVIVPKEVYILENQRKLLFDTSRLWDVLDKEA